MSPRVQSPPHVAASLRVFAGLLALVVLALAIATQSPAAHAWLHGASKTACADKNPTDSPADSGCPVALLTQGLTAPITDAALPVPRIHGVLTLAPSAAAVAPAAPARLHPPAQAPPGDLA